jgi:hypothetical protein
MATYYVAKTGSDSNPGTLAAPWLTISKGISMIGFAGDTLIFRAGIYNGQVFISGKNGNSSGYITIQAYQGEAVVIDGTGINLGTDLNSTWANGLVKIWNSSYIIFNGFEVYNADTYGSDGVTVYAADGKSCNYITLQNLKIHQTGRSGIDFVTSSPSSTARHNNMTVYNCQVYDTNWAGDQEAISMSHVINGEVSYCLVHDVHLVGSYRQQGIDAKDASTGILIHHNEVYTASIGLYFDSSVSVTAYANKVHDITNGGACIMLGHETTASTNLNASLYNNELYNAPCLFKVAAPATDNGTYTYTFNFINNTLYGFQEGDYAPIVFYGKAADYISCVVRNNINQCVQTGYALNLLYCQNAPTGITIDHNLWYNPGGVSAATYKGTSYITSNPLMVNPITDFHLQSTSPAINAGSASGAPTTDFDGNARPQGSAYDIGAYEYVSPGYQIYAGQNILNVQMVHT